jgi:hypothetical protein
MSVSILKVMTIPTLLMTGVPMAVPVIDEARRMSEQGALKRRMSDRRFRLVDAARFVALRPDARRPPWDRRLRHRDTA